MNLSKEIRDDIKEADDILTSATQTLDPDIFREAKAKQNRIKKKIEIEQK